MSKNIRPHHFLDILRDYGYGIRYQPHEYEHALHRIGEDLLGNLDREIVLVIAADDICRPRLHLRADGRCDDTMMRGEEIISKQDYNDGLDRWLWVHLELDRANRMTVGEFCRCGRGYLDGIEAVCAHPEEDPACRRIGLIEGLKKLNVER